jgi:hypothetical protein
LNQTSWLRTDEIQFLLAFLIRNQQNSFFHVLGPSTTDTLSQLYKTMTKILEKSATERDYKSHDSNMSSLMKIIDSSLDIFERKFIVFLCNIRRNHWISVVVVNPFLISRPYLKGHDELADSAHDDLCGWCIFDSISTNPKEKTDQGFGGTFFTKLDASLGVRLFLNICAS